ncbi:Asparagine synthetase [glutamine-hydrolyzing] [Flavobacterium longum]|uniref:asparagine synthase (glutamine-hydrolyzing) n=1 Tax=Flavobacterium longum TaxID=1299340 RepID=UPI0039E8B4B6
MCGITGIVGQQATAEKLAAMLRAQKHRGPDATGEFVDSQTTALGHNRLSIIDLSECANQPFTDYSGRYVMVFNGEIYNYLELRDELRDRYDFVTQSDTEVLLAAWTIFGKQMLPKLNGMFALAIWDKETQSLFAARDRFGVKPFNYTVKDGNLYFSSEIKAIHAAGIPALPDEKVWASYLVYGDYGQPDETFWKDIKQLPGGFWLEWQQGNLKTGQWYDFVAEVKKQPQNLSYEASKSHYVALLKDSIALRFRADVPVGFNISGGLDSSVLLAMVNDFAHGHSHINAYTFYTGNPDYDELPWVEMMIAHTENPLQKVLLQPDEISALAENISFHEDEPFGGIPTLAYAKLFQRARRDGVKVLLDGQGMDEQWAGYDYYVKSDDVTIQGVAGSPYKPEVLSEAFFRLAEKPVYPKPFDDDMRNKQYRDLFYTKIPRALRFNDRVSMAYGTELREPFLDYRLVEFAFSRPVDFKIRDGVRKWLLRDLAAEYLSDALVFAPKRPLQTPQREWLANDLKPFVDICLGKIAQSPAGSWFDRDRLQKAWQQYQDGDQASSFHVWQWVSVALCV